MSGRLTIKRLDEMDDLLLISTILSERRNRLHPYTPLAQRIAKVQGKIDRRNIFSCPDGKVFDKTKNRCVKRK